jgi:hypothetical protein
MVEPEPDAAADASPDAVPGVPAPTGRRSVGPDLRLGRWPFGLLLVAILRTIDAIGLLALGLAARGLPIAGWPILANDTLATRAFEVGLAVLTLVGVVGLLRFERWGWVLTLVLVGVSLIGDLIRVWLGHPDYLLMTLHVVTAFYLNGRSVRALADPSLRSDAEPPVR